MVAGEYIPARGDIVWLCLTPLARPEQEGDSPALVLSPRAYNERTNLSLCCPITTKANGYPFEVNIQGASPVSGVVLADQIKSVNWQARHARFKGHAAPNVVSEVLEKVKVLFE